MSITAKELEQALTQAAIKAEESDEYSPFSDYGEIWSPLGYGDVELPLKLIDDVVITRVVEDHGGGEGSGEERWIVFEVTSGGDTQLFRKDGVYYSYDGSNWDGYLLEVEPYQKTITVYKVKKT